MFKHDELHPDALKRRDYLVKLLSAATLSIAPFGLAYPAWWSKSSKKLEQNKSIYSLQGGVSVNGKKAGLDTRIAAGDSVSTDSKGEIFFVVGGDAFIIRKSSEMEIEGSGFFVKTLRLITGGMLSVFATRASGESLNMHTTTAILGIRGTGVYLETEPDLSYLCTCY